MDAAMEFQKTRWHRPVDMGIRGFKQFVRGLDLSNRAKRVMIQRYKNRAWMEFRGLPEPKGTFPTHPRYGNDIKVIGTEDEESPEYEIRVKHGKQ